MLFGIPMTRPEAVRRAKLFQRPYDTSFQVPDHLLDTMFQVLTKGPEAVHKEMAERLKWLKSGVKQHPAKGLPTCKVHLLGFSKPRIRPPAVHDHAKTVLLLLHEKQTHLLNCRLCTEFNQAQPMQPHHETCKSLGTVELRILVDPPHSALDQLGLSL